MKKRTKGPAAMLKSEEVADLLNVSPRTIWRMVAAGKIPEPTRFNRKLVRWHRADVEAYLDGLRVAGVAR